MNPAAKGRNFEIRFENPKTKSRRIRSSKKIKYPEWKKNRWKKFSARRNNIFCRKKGEKLTIVRFDFDFFETGGATRRIQFPTSRVFEIFKSDRNFMVKKPFQFFFRQMPMPSMLNSH
jgi:hypothetical protein